jgi:polysaccharide biosynthesis protein PslH
MRIYQLLRGLAERQEVTCLSFAPDLAAEQALAPLQRVCRVVTVQGPAPRGMPRRAWTTLASSLPDMALRNASAAYGQALSALLATERFDVVQAESIEMAGYLLQIMSYELRVTSSRRGWSGKSQTPNSKLVTHNSRLVLDQFNAEYLLQKRAALTGLKAALAPSIRNPASNVRELAGGAYSLAQWRKLARYEAAVMRACDLVLAVADEDRATLGRLVPSARIGVVPNGVDSEHFSRAALAYDRASPLAFGQPTLVFSGST